METRNQMSTRNHVRHGLTSHELYNCWKKMVHRCHNDYHKKYRIYGARGITVCDAWRQDFRNFLADMPPRPSREFTLNRIDNNKGYEPGNVAWSTQLEQQRNRRNNRLMEYQGEHKTAGEWAEIFGADVGRTQSRTRIGWSLIQAIYLLPYTTRKNCFRITDPGALAILAHYR